MDNFLTPVDVNHIYTGGTLCIFDASEDQLIQSGLLRPSEVPGLALRCKTNRGDFDCLVKTCRLKDGRIRLTLSRSLVAIRLDRSFSRFLSSVVPVTAGSDHA